MTACGGKLFIPQKQTAPAEWGKGQKIASLSELLGEEEAHYYKKLVWNGLAKQNLSADELNKFAQYAEGIITREQAEAILAASEEAYDLLQLELGPRPAGVEIQLNRINPKAVETMVGMQQVDSPLHKLLSSIAPNGAQAAEDVLTEGILLGWNPRKTAPLIRNTLGTQLTRALTIARTETLRAYRTAAQQTYRENANIVKGWTWQAALDDRTCASCFAQHGSEHPLDEDFGSHPNCRCSPVPETYSWEEIGARYGIDLSDLDGESKDAEWEAAAKKYFKNGKPNELQQKWLEQTKLRGMKGEEAFKTFDPQKQIKILGPGKWTAWRDGAIKFDELSKKTWSPIWGTGATTVSLRDFFDDKQASRYSELGIEYLRIISKEKGAASKAAKEAAENLIHKYEKYEPELTETIIDLVHKSGGHMEGLDFRLKSEGSLARKISSDAQDSGVSEDKVAQFITDVSRYTAIYKPQELVEKYDIIKSGLEKKGFEITKIKNMFGSGGPYEGLHMIVYNARDDIYFELQLHTKQSFKTKMGNHVDYEVARAAGVSDPLKKIVQKWMMATWKDFERPVNYQLVQDYSKRKQ